MSKARSGKAIFYALLIFVAGLTSGLLLAPIIGRTFLRPPLPAEFARFMLSRMKSDLDLTPEQLTQIKPLLEQTALDIEAIRAETTNRVSTRIEQTHASIAPHLRPEQQQKLAEIEAKRRKHMPSLPFDGLSPPK